MTGALASEPAQGWYPDPGGQFEYRYWQDGAWTTWASVDGRARPKPLPARRRVEPLLELPARSLWWALGGYLVAIVAATAAAVSFDSLAASLAASTALLYAGLVGSTWIVTRRYGTGSLVTDLGLRFRKADLGAGFGTATTARALAAAVTIIVLAVSSDDSESTNVQFDVFESSDTALYLALLIAVIAAPFVEEIFFRGLLQGALTNWLGPVAGISVQGVLFAATHYQVDATALENTTIFLAILAAGVVFGIAYRLTGRLGTSIVAHALFNLLAAVVILVN